MCGLVGVLVFDNNNFIVSEDFLIKMRDTMVHRGPDGAGVWISPDKKVGFGHRRLAVIDLSAAAAQPMSNEDQTIWVSYNGEIYNHTEIRRELKEIGGHRWKTDHSDTEVIIHAFEQWGINCLEKFRGMFAIALWDGRKNELWLVRDRLGIKPLYYSIHHGRLVFASEIKALLEDPEQKRQVNDEAFYHYLSFLTTPSPQTLFEGIKKLPPGTWLKINSDGVVQEYKYWDVWDYAKSLSGIPEDEIAYHLLEELRMAVRYRKISDVPVGVFLSGGIDSSTNAVLFSENEKNPVKTFSVGYDREYSSYQNEFHYARKIARLINSEHYEIKLTLDDLINFLPKLIYHQDEPIADPVCVPVYFVSKLARDNGVIVCQVGEGSDELFCGYPWWQNLLIFQKFSYKPFSGAFRKTGMAMLSFLGKNNSSYYEWFRRTYLGQPVFWGGAEAFFEEEKKKLLSQSLRKKFSTYSSFEILKPVWERFKIRAWDKSALNWMSYLDLNYRLPELLLMRVDKMSMAVSLEARVPFLDHKFVELAMSIPETIKIKNGELKHILKKAVKGLIPDEIINRKKLGFGVPVYEWFLDKLGDFARGKISNFVRRTDFFDATYFLKAKSNEKIWYLLNFVLWYERWIEGKN
jgi:asparagine synthase (glutamine-hydrolysing)